LRYNDKENKNAKQTSLLFFINRDLIWFISGSEENPTLLHFAARFGLEKLAWQLLECPGGDLACDLKNVSELTPADLADQAGHTRLAHQLRGYMVQKPHL